MDAASTALNSLFSKTPAPGTRDGTSIADTEGGQKAVQGTEQAGQKAEELANQAGQKAGEVADQAEQKLGQAADTAERKLNQATDSTTASSTSGSSGSTVQQQAPSVDKVTEETDKVADKTVAPAVEHDKITRQHETRERDVIEKEVHKDHYHTTVQPLKDREVQDTEHKYEEKPTEYRETNKDDGAAAAKVAEKLDGFEDTVQEGKTQETQAKDDTVLGEHVHHHHHEIVQPVIEKEIVKPSVTHVTNPIKETVHEKSEDHGVTTAKAISVDDFKGNLDGETTKSVKADKVPT